MPVVGSLVLGLAFAAVAGRVVDTAPAGVAAFVRVVRAETGEVAGRVRAEASGEFVVDGLAAGRYSVTAWAQGFRRAEVKGVMVREGERRELGEMVLEVAGCDAPGVHCLWVPATQREREPEWMRRIRFRDYRVLKVECGADVDERDPGRCVERPALADVRLKREGERLVLVAENGARLAVAGGECDKAAYRETRMEVDGLGPGVDFCVKSAAGNEAHVYFTGDVEPGMAEIRFWFVIRGKR
jgi:hypothetical protein